MSKQAWIIVLLVAAVVSLAYAIYRSTMERITVVENGQQIVYGEPQHGLVLGLCLFAGFCVISAVLLVMNKEEWRTEHKTLSKRTV
ncbi:MAG TPA: hypothetical protein VFS22_06645 [Flavisolibacter sp.]|nr:hypothetical protein [Flavisolibacter sp.]